MHADADRWLRSLPKELAPHREVMLGLLREAERDPGIRLLVVGCSIGRGAADELSDVDAMYAVVDTAWNDALHESAGVVRRLGDVIDMHQQIIDPANRELPLYQHTFAQYASGVQLDLVVALSRGSARLRGRTGSSCMTRTGGSSARRSRAPQRKSTSVSGCTSRSYISAPARNT